MRHRGFLTWDIQTGPFAACQTDFVPKCVHHLDLYKAVGREAFEGLHFLASLPLAGAGREKTQPFNRIHSRLFTPTTGRQRKMSYRIYPLWNYLCSFYQPWVRCN